MISLANKYIYVFDSNLDETLAMIKEKAYQEKLYVRLNNGELIVRAPKLLLGGLPVNFQISFIAKVFERDEEIIVQGKFDAPRLFYQIATGVFIVFVTLFLWLSYSDGGGIAHLIPSVVLLAVFGIALMKIYVEVSKRAFTRQNEIVLAFFEALEEEHRKM